MVAEEIVVSLSGGAPWGFRLQGGADQQKPLQVAKVRRRSKACRAGLKEHDELVAIGDHVCADLSHAQAMSLLDSQSASLSLRVKRSPSVFHSSSYSTRSTSPRSSSSSMRVLSPDMASFPPHILSPTGTPKGITSPPDSEAYYGETDSDADTQSLTHRRQRRTPPHARSPARYDHQEEEETSEMSGYESATDGGVPLQGQWDGLCLPGVPRRELIYQPFQTDWTTPAHTPHNLTPHTLTPHTLTPPPPDQGLAEAEGEGDSGFQEAGACSGLGCAPLVSPERAKEAMMLGSSKQLVPMVGPQLTPISDELSTTYMDKAKQAKLQRGESVVEKQVKEARTKCRSIASLLTDAPNPNSKGVLMFKKRRQRAKKYTLTCFGKADGDGGAETEGETGGETEEEGGSSVLSGSEVDEEGFSASFDPTWDSGYLDLLDRRSSACPSTAPTTPSANHCPPLDVSAYQSLLSPVNLGLAGSQPDQRLESSVAKQPIRSQLADMSPPAVANGGMVAVSRASVVLTPPSQSPLASQNGHHHGNSPPHLSPSPAADSDYHPNANLSPNGAGVLNRTARPFTPGPTPARASVTSVMFRPPQPKPTAVTAESRPAAAVSMVTIPTGRHPPGPDARRAVSSTSLYIPARNNSTQPSVNSPPSSVLSPPSSLSSAPPHAAAFSALSPPSAQGIYSPHVPTFNPPATYPLPPALAYPPPSTYFPPSPMSPPSAPVPSQVSFEPPPTHLPPPVQASPSYLSTVTPSAPAAMTTASPPQAPASDSLETREQRISVPASRTGILHDARRRANNKPMFSSVQKIDVSPNPDLLSMVQNMDDRFVRPGSGPAPGGEAGHESGPEEDWLRLGAEACNFMQAQRGPKPPPVAPKPQAPQLPQLAGKGGQLFARRQNRMDRYVVERSPSVAATPYSPAQTREPSPTPSLPAAWKLSSSIRAPPPINYNPLLSPSCPLKAQKKPEVKKSATAGSKGKKAILTPVDIMSHQPYQLSSSLFSYGSGVPQGGAGVPQKTARVCEVKRFSTPPPTSTGPALKVLAPRSATTLGEPMWRSDMASPPTFGPTFYPQPNQAQWAAVPLSPPAPPAPTAPLPQLPTFSSSASLAANPVQSCTFSPPPSATQTGWGFKSAPDLSPLRPAAASQPSSSGAQPSRVPRPRFSTSNLGLQPSVWRPGSTMH